MGGWEIMFWLVFGLEMTVIGEMHLYFALLIFVCCEEEWNDGGQKPEH